MFLPATLIPACASSSLAFLMMYSAYKLKCRVTIYSLDILLFLFETSPLSHSSSNCCFLTCLQVSQEAGKVIWYSHHFRNFPLFIVIYTVKVFSIVNEADVFLELSCFFDDPTDAGNLISGSSAFSKTSEHLDVPSSHIVEVWLGEFSALFYY